MSLGCTIGIHVNRIDPFVLLKSLEAADVAECYGVVIVDEYVRWSNRRMAESILM